MLTRIMEESEEQIDYDIHLRSSSAAGEASGPTGDTKRTWRDNKSLVPTDIETENEQNLLECLSGPMVSKAGGASGATGDANVEKEKSGRKETRLDSGKAKAGEFSGLAGGASGATGTGCVEKLGALITIAPDVINSIGEDGWEEIELAVDSGASETVVSEDMIASAEIKEGPAARRGIQYEVANGVRIPNLGEKRFIGTSEEGVRRHITAQVCEVNKGLLSVRRMVQAGNTVVFTRSGSYIEDNGTGERMHMEERNGMYMLKLWTRSERTSGF